MAILKHVDPPDIGTELVPPRVSGAEYRARLDAVAQRMRERGLDVLVVYADREHCATISYCTGFDPRFEEAMLLLGKDGSRLLVVGNECMGHLPDEAIGVPVRLFQEFSLMGQPRGSSPTLRRLLSEFGVTAGAKVGCAGWKYYLPGNLDDAEHAIEIPAYLVDALRDLCGTRENVVNANPIFTHPGDGLRLANSADQIAVFEYGAIQCSEGVRRVLGELKPGVAENELERLLDSRGVPLSCHRIIRFGEGVRRGLASPSASRAKLGDMFSVGFGVEGSLTCRAGTLASGPEDLPEEVRDFYPRMVANYFDVFAAWYGAVRVGATAGEVFAAAEAARDPSLYEFSLNPGHYIGIDEWVHSPFEPGSDVVLKSGTMLQMDIIPHPAADRLVVTNAEDGLALADEALRSELASRHPALWQRVQRRRAFMIEKLGMRLDESLLPLGNTSGWLAPYALSLDTCFACL